MKPILKIGIALIINFQLVISNAYAQSPVDSVSSGCTLDFNGANNYVNIPHKTNLNFGLPNSTFSISVWVKTSVGGPILSKSRPNNNTHMPYVLSINSFGRFVFLRWHQVPGGIANTITSINAVNDNKWHHIVFVNESSSIHNIYIDGILDIQDNILWTTDDSNSEPIYIGKYHNYIWGQTYFTAQIDEVRIWNKALTQTEIRQNMCKKLTGTEAGLVGYWRFDDCGGLTAIDATANGNNGTLN